jgi:hypothetical protein
MLMMERKGRKTMSHHLDSPLAQQDVRLDITDLYVFRGDDGTVFAMNVKTWPTTPNTWLTRSRRSSRRTGM